MDYTQTNKEHHILRVVQSILVLILILFITLQMFNVHLMLGTAKVINYTGLIRGGTQRLIKLELNNTVEDPMIQHLDSIFEALENGGGEYKLKKISYAPFVHKLNSLHVEWNELKNQIYLFRNGEFEKESLVLSSETYFHNSDETVFAAQAYAEKLTERQTFYEIFMIFCIVFIISILIKLSIDAVRFSRIAYIDKHTKLPNKSRCEEIINDKAVLDKFTALIMFDLNYLKKVNDTLGHSAGDSLILNFATVLRKSIPARYFIGRFGGDEFICVLKNVDESEVQQIIDNVNNEIERFNSLSRQPSISFAYGYAHSAEYEECTMNNLLELADQKMYLLKKEMHTLRED